VPFFLRKVRFNRWFNIEECPWLAKDELPADPLGDLETSNNELSLWQIEEDQSNLERIITAIAANRESVQNVDYILFNQEIFSEIGINIKKIDGSTPDKEANTSWHCDLIQLSAQKLVKLTAKIVYSNVEPVRVKESRVTQLIKKCY